LAWGLRAIGVLRSRAMLRQWAAGCVALLSLTACASLQAAAATAFSSQFSCPEDRVQVTVIGPAEQRRDPPDEIAKDSERLAIWRRAEERRLRSDDTSVRVEGCNHEHVYRCYTPAKHPLSHDCL